MELTKEICQNQQIGVIVVLHDLALAAQYCQNVIILKEGKIRVFGSPDRVINAEIIQDTYDVSVIVGRDPSTSLNYIIPNIKTPSDKGSVH